MTGLGSAESAPHSLSYTVQEIQKTGVVGVLYRPQSTKPVPVVVVLGGSGGRLNDHHPIMLAEQGYGVLALAYFNAEGLPDTLDRVPIETVSHALDYLETLPWVETGRFGILGVSRGSELALLSAAHDSRIQAVVGIVPSAVAWHGQRSDVAWTRQGVAVPSLGFDRHSDRPLLARASAALDDDQAVAPARIPVETINGPVLLVSARFDHIWPSERMAQMIETTLNTLAFDFKVEHIRVADDHSLSVQSRQNLEAELVGWFETIRR